MTDDTARAFLALTETLQRVMAENIYQREVIRAYQGQVAGLEARLGERPSMVYPDGHPGAGRAPGEGAQVPAGE